MGDCESVLFDHGASAYSNHGCRCAICRSAASTKKADRRARNGREKLSDEAKVRLLANQRARRKNDKYRAYDRERKRRKRSEKKAMT